MVESVAATVQDVNTSMDQAERDLASSALQPLQAVLETLKMVTISRWSQDYVQVPPLKVHVLTVPLFIVSVFSRDRRDFDSLLEIKK
jgi:hypothetical protein